eukprot:gene10068-18714_t
MSESNTSDHESISTAGISSETSDEENYGVVLLGAAAPYHDKDGISREKLAGHFVEECTDVDRKSMRRSRNWWVLQKTPDRSISESSAGVEAVIEAMTCKSKDEAKKAFEAWINTEEDKHKDVKTKKLQVVCPVKGSNKKVVDLIRHLTILHGWDTAEAKVAWGKFGLRKQRLLKKGRVLKNYTKMVCPVSSCRQVVKRLRNHLSQTHKIRDKINLESIMSAAVVFKDTEVAGLEETAEPSSFLGNRENRERVVEIPLSPQEGVSDDASSVISEHDEPMDDKMVNVNRWRAEKERDAALHVAQLKRIINHVDLDDSNGDNVLVLFDANELNEKWLALFQNEKKPGTVKAYLHSLLHFYDFVIAIPAAFELPQEEIRKS